MSETDSEFEAFSKVLSEYCSLVEKLRRVGAPPKPPFWLQCWARGVNMPVEYIKENNCICSSPDCRCGVRKIRKLGEE